MWVLTTLILPNGNINKLAEIWDHTCATLKYDTAVRHAAEMRTACRWKKWYPFTLLPACFLLVSGAAIIPLIAAQMKICFNDDERHLYKLKKFTSENTWKDSLQNLALQTTKTRQQSETLPSRDRNTRWWLKRPSISIISKSREANFTSEWNLTSKSRRWKSSSKFHGSSCWPYTTIKCELTFFKVRKKNICLLT